MTTQQYLKNLCTPKGPIDVLLDTDAYNEIDDQYAISYLLAYPEKLRIKGICAAPFYNENSTSPADGMEKSYDEIKKLLTLAGRTDLNGIVYRGSEGYLPDEKTPVNSEAAAFMADLADHYSPESPLYIVAIGAITNVASAILMNPKMQENCVIVWLGGHGHHLPDGVKEFNMMQDIAGARVLFGCGVPVVQLPCGGVVDRFAASRYELEHWLKGKSPLCDYLLAHTIEAAESYAAGKPWTRVVWDVTTIGWLVNEDGRFMLDRLTTSPICEYDGHYAFDPGREMIRYVWQVNRDALFEDLFERLTKL